MGLIFAVVGINIEKLQLKRSNEDEIMDLEYFKMQIKHEYIN